jgi:hypothetical protein
LWTDLDILAVPPAAGSSVPHDICLSFMNDVTSFHHRDQSDQTSITEHITLASTVNSAQAATSPSQAQPRYGRKDAIAFAPTFPSRGRPNEAQSILKRVSVRFPCPVEEVSNVMALLAGTGLNATIIIGSDKVPVKS